VPVAEAAALVELLARQRRPPCFERKPYAAERGADQAARADHYERGHGDDQAADDAASQ
jgi:hypothetical protein